MKLDRFSANFQLVLSNAQSIALNKNNQFVEPVHVMYAFLKEKTEPVYIFLEHFGANINQIMKSVTEKCNSLPKVERTEENICCSYE